MPERSPCPPAGAPGALPASSRYLPTPVVVADAAAAVVAVVVVAAAAVAALGVARSPRGPALLLPRSALARAPSHGATGGAGSPQRWRDTVDP